MGGREVGGGYAEHGRAAVRGGRGWGAQAGGVGVGRGEELPLTRRAARVDLSPLRGARWGGRFAGRGGRRGAPEQIVHPPADVTGACRAQATHARPTSSW